MVLGIRPRHEVQMSFLTEVLEYSERNNLSAWWTEELRQVVERGCGPTLQVREKKKRFPWGLFGKVKKS